MAPEITGTLETRKETEFVGQNRTPKRLFGILTLGERPKLAMFTLIGEKNVDLVKNMKRGDKIKVVFNPESREYNDRYYTENVAWKVELVKDAPKQQPQREPAYSEEDDSSLPF